MNLHNRANCFRTVLLILTLNLFGPLALGQVADPYHHNQDAKRLAVTEYLLSQGVPDGEAEARVANLSDAEIQELDLALEKERAGQDSTVTLGVGTAILIGLILFIL